MGSAAAVTMSGRRSLRAMLIPASEPPVPIAHTNPSTFPSVCSQISGPVPSTWASRFAVLSHWFAHRTPFGSVAASSFARRSDVRT